MESVRGIVASLRCKVEISGGGETAVRNTHVAEFRLAGRAVRLTSNEPLQLANGDDIVAVGEERDGALHAFAHLNATTGIKGDDGWLAAMIVGTVFCLIGVLALGGGWFALSELRTGGAWNLVLAIPLLFLGLGVWMFSGAVRVRRAVQSLPAS